MSTEAKKEAGFLLRQLQRGDVLSPPESKPMPSIGARCHELIVNDKDHWWRIIYRTDSDAIVVLDVFQKQTNETPQAVITNCKQRLKNYDS